MNVLLTYACNLAASRPTTPESPSDPESTPDSLPSSGFRAIALQHMAQADLDDDGDNGTAFTIWEPVSISKLFNFDAKHWADEYVKHIQYSFDEELALYELLDLDADGEEENEDDAVDDSMAEILTG